MDAARSQLFADLFELELDVLRGMGKLNDAQCPQDVYTAQFKLVKALKDVVIYAQSQPEAIVEFALQTNEVPLNALLEILERRGIYVYGRTDKRRE